MAIRSLALRLVIGAGLWIAVALIAGGIALSTLFRDYVEESFDTRLTVLLESLVAVSELDADGRPQVSRSVGETRFDQPYSGWYWQIAQGAEPVLRSRSLWDQVLPVGSSPARAAAVPSEVEG